MNEHHNLDEIYSNTIDENMNEIPLDLQEFVENLYPLNAPFSYVTLNSIVLEHRVEYLYPNKVEEYIYVLYTAPIPEWMSMSEIPSLLTNMVIQETIYEPDWSSFQQVVRWLYDCILLVHLQQEINGIEHSYYFTINACHVLDKIAYLESIKHDLLLEKLELEQKGEAVPYTLEKEVSNIHRFINTKMLSPEQVTDINITRSILPSFFRDMRWLDVVNLPFETLQLMREEITRIDPKIYLTTLMQARGRDELLYESVVNSIRMRDELRPSAPDESEILAPESGGCLIS